MNIHFSSKSLELIYFLKKSREIKSIYSHIFHSFPSSIMVKTKFTSADVAAMVASVRPHIVGARVANVYDIAGKLFLIKFTSSLVVAEEDEGKATLLFEAGVRFHLTTFERKKAAIPSGWTMNLRKLLKGKQLERVDQIGCDRVVVFQFGVGEKAFFVILELYAKGNVVVTDAGHRIQMLLRSHVFDSGVSIAKNEVYPMAQSASVMEPVLSNWASNQGIFETIQKIDISKLREELLKRKKKHVGETLSCAERLLCRIAPFAHSSLVASALSQTSGETGFEWISNAVNFALTIWDNAKSMTQDQGFISYSNGPSSVQEFAPLETLLPQQRSDMKTFPSFSQAVDEFYQSLETSGDANRVEAQRIALSSKVEKIKIDQERRISELKAEQLALWEKADRLEQELEVCDAGIAIINALIAKQMTWAEISATMAAQGEAGHPIARRIGRIYFKKNSFELKLEDEIVVLVDLSLNATGNVSALHLLRKQQREKLAKTEDQAAIATKQAEAKLKQDLTKYNDTIERSRHLAKVRKRFWFEKFYWFLTSEGFLVIAGRDATQNEAIYKKYLKTRDVYVHADIHGAATVVVKNHLPSGDIPPLSLAEAGQFSLCHSSAWSSKIVTSAWWVRAEQVSKTAPTGEYLTTGSFMIRGRKNFLPPARLELGVGVLFYVSEDCMKSRGPERVVRSQIDENGATEEVADLGEVVSFVESVGKVVKQKLQNKKQSEGKVEAPKVAVVEEKSKTAEAKATTKKGKKKTPGKKDKYVFDDEAEDEKIRMKLLGVKSKLVEEGEGHVCESDQLGESKSPVVKNCYVCGSEEHLAADCPSKPSKKTKEVVEDAEGEEGPGLADNTVLERLFGTVQPEDELIHAIPVCGPYGALSSCQLKAKIVPGSMKRGKAAKLCATMFGGSGESAVKKLVKLIPVEEFSECLVNDVKIAAAGVTKLQTDAKLAKIKNAKSKSSQ